MIEADPPNRAEKKTFNLCLAAVYQLMILIIARDFNIFKSYQFSCLPVGLIPRVISYFHSVPVAKRSYKLFPMHQAALICLTFLSFSRPWPTQKEGEVAIASKRFLATVNK